MTIGKRDRTRERLLAAAQELLLEGGFSALGTQPLSERAGVALGTIYNYFRTRDEIADAVVALMIAAFLRSIEKITADLTDPADIMSASMRQTLHWMSPHCSLGRLLFNSGLPMARYLYQTRQGFVRDVQYGLQQGRFVMANEAVTSSMIVGAVIAILFDLFLGQAQPNVIEQVAEQSLIMLGIPTHEATHIAYKPLTFITTPLFPLSAIELLPPLQEIHSPS